MFLPDINRLSILSSFSLLKQRCTRHRSQGDWIVVEEHTRLLKILVKRIGWMNFSVLFAIITPPLFRSFSLTTFSRHLFT